MEIFLDDPQAALLLTLVALAAGFVDAVAGGGGMMVMPALLSTGMPPHLVLGTNKLVSTFGTLSASLTFIRKGLFTPGLWWAASLATFVGALSGTLLIYILSAELLKKLLPLAIMAAAVYLVWPRQHRHQPADPTVVYVPSRRAKLLSGSVIGFYDGFIGPGTGAFWMAVALRAFRQDIVRAAGVARFMNLISNATSLLTFMALASVDYGLGLMMGTALMIGALIGAHSAIRFGNPLIRPLFIIVVLIMAGRLVLTEFL